MDFFVPYDQLGVATPGPWQNASPAAGTRGSILNALVFPAIQNEILNVQDEAGVTRDAANFSQLLQAIRSGKLTFFVDAGTADGLVVAPRTSFANLQAGVVVTVLKSGAANATTTPTLKIGSAAAMSIVKYDGSALAIGDLPANAILTLRSDGTNFRYQGLARSDVSASITKQQILNITGGVGFSGSKKIQTYQPSSPSSQTISQEFTAPARGTVLVFSTASSTAQPGLANYATITVNDTVAAQTGDSVGGSINDVAVAQVNTGDDVIAASMIVNSQALTYNVSQQLNFLFFPS